MNGSNNSSHDLQDFEGDVLFSALLTLGFDSSNLEKVEKTPVNAVSIDY